MLRCIIMKNSFVIEIERDIYNIGSSVDYMGSITYEDIKFSYDEELKQYNVIYNYVNSLWFDEVLDWRSSKWENTTNYTIY